MKTPTPPRKPRPPAKWRPTTPSKKAIQRGNKFLAPCLALAFVLAGSAVWAEPTDWALYTPSERMCAKTHESCEIARHAIWEGWLLGIPKGTFSVCQIHPDCFDPASNVIPGYHGR